ncbi:hypothetical protein ACFWNU_24855, partial [Streptomyces sp. NPDC058427]|uniref:hypothetical protein n=1 Tax=Streptomyces sp. NPDC058427 TaxID=3346494 RepID=UPI003645F69F
MLNNIRREAITMVPEGTRVPLRHLCREQDGARGPAAGPSPADAVAQDEDLLLSRLLLLQLTEAGQVSGATPPPLPEGGLRRWLDESV